MVLDRKIMISRIFISDKHKLVKKLMIKLIVLLYSSLKQPPCNIRYTDSITIIFFFVIPQKAWILCFWDMANLMSSIFCTLSLAALLAPVIEYFEVLGVGI